MAEERITKNHLVMRNLKVFALYNGSSERGRPYYTIILLYTRGEAKEVVAARHMTKL
jgi:hypothetical protein